MQYCVQYGVPYGAQFNRSAVVVQSIAQCGVLRKPQPLTSPSPPVSLCPRQRQLLSGKPTPPRFEFDYETMERVKVQQAFKYPLALDMEPFVEGRAWDGNDNSDESQVKDTALMLNILRAL